MVWGEAIQVLAAPPAMREWAVKLKAKPKCVVSSTRKDLPWTNSHHIAGDLRTAVQKLKDAPPDGMLLGSGKLAAELDRLGLISAKPLRSGAPTTPAKGYSLVRWSAWSMRTTQRRSAFGPGLAGYRSLQSDSSLRCCRLIEPQARAVSAAHRHLP